MKTGSILAKKWEKIIKESTRLYPFCFRSENKNEGVFKVVSISSDFYNSEEKMVSFVHEDDLEKIFHLKYDQFVNEFSPMSPTRMDVHFEYIAVYQTGGIIDDVERNISLEEAVYDMNYNLFRSGFDHEKDDARIFGLANEEVYSFPNEFCERCEELDIDDDTYAKLAVLLWKNKIDEETDLNQAIAMIEEE